MTREELPADLTSAYDVGAPLATGGFGAVYRARHRLLGRDLAVKLLHDDVGADADAVRRFLAEARVAAQVEHPHVVRVHAAGTGEMPDGRRPWIAYELAVGPSVARLIERGPLEPARAAAIGAQVAHGLAAAHARGIVHRDVKPDNVLEVAPGRFALCDFGIALWNDALRVRTATGVILGTPAYVAPEVVRGEPASPSSDLYALGVMVYEMVTGRRPFDGGSLVDQLRAHLETPAPDLRQAAPGTPPALAAAVARALAKLPGDRFESADAFAAALESAAEPAGKTETVKRTLAAPVARGAAPTVVVAREDRNSAGAKSASGPPRFPAATLGAATAVLLVALVAVQSITRGQLRPVAATSVAPPVSVSAPPSALASPGPTAGPASPPAPKARFTQDVIKATQNANAQHRLGLHGEELRWRCQALLAHQHQLAGGPKQRQARFEHWMQLRRDIAVCPHASPTERATLFDELLYSNADYRAAESVAFRDSLRNPDSAVIFDHGQVQLDTPAALTPHLKGSWLAELDDSSSRATRPLAGALYALRRQELATPGGAELVDGKLVDAGAEQLGQALVTAELGLETDLAPGQSLRELSELVILARVLIPRVAQVGVSSQAKFRIARAARRIAELAAVHLPHHAPVLTRALGDAVAPDACDWLRLWLRGRSHHGEGDHLGECKDFVRALVAFEKQVGFASRNLSEVPRQDTLTWLRLRAEVDPTADPRVKPHKSVPDAAAELLDSSWLPREEFAKRRAEFHGRAGLQDQPRAAPR